jgi:hypothetical protein
LSAALGAAGEHAVGVFLDDVERAVGGIVIDDDELNVGIGLRFDAF